MANKYHISKTTHRPNICVAKGACPIGGEHFDNKDDARAYIEKKNEKEFGNFSTHSKSGKVNANESRLRTPIARKQHAMDNHSIKFTDATVEDGIVSFSGGYKAKVVERGKSGIMKGYALRELMDDSRFDSLSPNNLNKLKTILDESERNYTDKAKKQILKVFSMSSNDAIGININYDARVRWREELLQDSYDYKHNLPLGTQAERKKFKKNRSRNPNASNTEHVQTGDTVISLASIKNSLRDFIPKSKNRKEAIAHSKNIFTLIFR